jgi:DNA (cytosine-5)-methyltransferase 1
MLSVGSLFAGIGGFDLGLERAGMRIAWHSEIDPYASAVLKKHWPHVPNHGDVRSIRAGTVEPVDVICGGFPCQDISNAGKRAGIDGERSGLWSEYARIVGELRPRYVIVENVAALLGRGIERVLGDLAALGFDAEWHCIPASAVGAPHKRDRVWLIAYADSESAGGGINPGATERGETATPPRATDAGDANSSGTRSRQPDVADANGERIYKRGSPRYLARELAAHIQQSGRGWASEDRGHSWWQSEPDVRRVADGVSQRVDRLRCLGNAIVPQVAEVIGRAIVTAERATEEGT